ncbi:hypothetical protein [Litorivivens sp.]|uniref:hypothetical protein n=1 Tax=Litorivivens sp. TaxID=2020868 RepID=UPI003569EF0A
MTPRHHLAFLPLALAFTAVGSTGESSDNVATGVAASPLATAIHSQVHDTSAAAPEWHSDIAPSTMRLESESDPELEAVVSVVVDRAAGSSSYLSVCTEFETEYTGYDVNYDSCILRTSNNGPAKYRILLPEGVDRLIAVSWHYTETLEPTYSLWEREEGQQHFVLQ